MQNLNIYNKLSINLKYSKQDDRVDEYFQQLISLKSKKLMQKQANPHKINTLSSKTFYKFK